jgi:hypothetical protein
MDDLKCTLKTLQAEGFRIKYTKKHTRVIHPMGKKFTCSNTPGCQHAHKNLLRDIKKYEQGVYK